MSVTQKAPFVPNSTRWNSFYMAVAKIHSIIENQTDSVLNSLCEKLGLPVFRLNEVNFALVNKMFVAKNTALPSSAAVERLFSIGGQILTPQRKGLSDEHFEELLMLRANRHLEENS